MNYLKVLLLICSSIFTVSCGYKKEPRPDVNHISSDFQILRFEQDFSAVDTASFTSEIMRLQKEYPVFFEIYFQQILADRPMKEEEVYGFVKEIVSEDYLGHITDTTLILLGDLTSTFKEIEQMIKYYRLYFQDFNPKVLVTFISEFGVGACTIGEDTLGLGLDMYLGADFEGYDPTVFPSFVRETMNPAYMPIHLGKTMVQNRIPGIQSNRMLDIMLYNGKVLYALERMLPDMPKHMLIEYNTEQWLWVVNNELQIWTHFLSNELLYSTRRQDFQKLTGPSPNAPNMPPEAPGQTANFIAWQIVKSYMKRFPETSLQDLMNLGDAQDLLEKSRYRPK